MTYCFANAEMKIFFILFCIIIDQSSSIITWSECDWCEEKNSAIAFISFSWYSHVSENSVQYVYKVQSSTKQLVVYLFAHIPHGQVATGRPSPLKINTFICSEGFTALEKICYNRTNINTGSMWLPKYTTLKLHSVNDFLTSTGGL